MSSRIHEDLKEAGKAMRDQKTLHRLGNVSEMFVKDPVVNELVGVSFYLRGYEVFIVARGMAEEGGPQVAFDQADTFEKAVMKTLVKAAYGGFKWKPDVRDQG